jgi:hypothetical protein
MDWDFVGIVAGLIGLIITIIGATWKIAGYVSGIGNKLDRLVENTASINTQIKGMSDKLVDSLIETVKKLTSPPFVKTGNPLTPEKIARRDQLLEKGRTYGLNPNEVQELRVILEEGAKDAAAGNFLALVGIIFLIGLLLSALSEK